MTDIIPPDPNPVAQFELWMKDAERAEPSEPNAMSLATTGLDGRPTVRIVLLKGVDDRGFVFFTNKESHKGDELGRDPHASLLFHWKSIGRQVRIGGVVEHVTDAEADTYFVTRPRVSRLGAWASDQSRPLPDRAELERRLAVYEQTYPDDQIPRPAHWGGYRLLPDRFEFWQNMPFRLHDRNLYTRQPDGLWAIVKLYP